MVLSAALIALISVGALRQDAAAELIYICRRADGSAMFTNVPGECGVVAHWKRDSKGSSSIQTLVRAASRRYGVDSRLVQAVIKVESDFDASARSPKGAMGLMQLMPDTARLYNIADAYDAGENIDGGVRHLRYLLNTFQGELKLVLAAYNAGIGAVEKYRGIPPYPETRQYVTRVLKFYDSYRLNDRPS